VDEYIEQRIAKTKNEKEIASLRAAAEHHRGGHEVPGGMVFADGKLINFQDYLPEMGPFVNGWFINWM